jgi:4-amino-4-deoxy-L-arabinose transferase-like glycosyltransferase
MSRINTHTLFAIALWGAICMCVIFQIYIAAYTPLLLDEAFTAYTVNQGWDRALDIAFRDTQPPLPTLLSLISNTILGPSELAQRTLSLIALCGTAWMAYLICKKSTSNYLYSLTASLIVMSASGYFQQYFVTNRYYGVMSFLMMYFMWYSIRRLETPTRNKNHTLLFVAALIFSLWYHVLFFSVYIPALALVHIGIALYKKDRSFIVETIRNFGIAYIIFLPWIPYFIQQMHLYQTNSGWPTDQPTFFLTLIEYFIQYMGIEKIFASSIWIYIAYTFLNVIVIFFALCGICTYHIKKYAVPILSTYIVVCAVGLYIFSQFKTLLTPSYYLPLFVPILCLGTIGLWYTANRRTAVYIISALTLISLISLTNGVRTLTAGDLRHNMRQLMHAQYISKDTTTLFVSHSQFTRAPADLFPAIQYLNTADMPLYVFGNSFDDLPYAGYKPLLFPTDFRDPTEVSSQFVYLFIDDKSSEAAKKFYELVSPHYRYLGYAYIDERSTPIYLMMYSRKNSPARR